MLSVQTHLWKPSILFRVFIVHWKEELTIILLCLNLDLNNPSLQ